MRLKRIILTLCVAWATSLNGASVLDAAQRARAEERWQGAMLAFDELNRTERHPGGALVFTGSSSIRRWRTLARDVAPYPSIQRGFGGSNFADLAHFAERILSPLRFRGIVIFAANDIVGGADDPSVDTVMRRVESVIATARGLKPRVPVFLIEITPTEARWSAWSDIQALNHALRRHCAADPNLHFIATADAFLNASGLPRAELFVDDRLHLNEAGYAVWSARIVQALDRFFKPQRAPRRHHRPAWRRF